MKKIIIAGTLAAFMGGCTTYDDKVVLVVEEINIHNVLLVECILQYQKDTSDSAQENGFKCLGNINLDTAKQIINILD